jgi:hypothetical protein
LAEGVQALIGGSFPMMSSYRKEEPRPTAAPAPIEEADWIDEAPTAAAANQETIAESGLPVFSRRPAR